jgi:hypothetical protein
VRERRKGKRCVLELGLRVSFGVVLKEHGMLSKVREGSQQPASGSS